MELPMKCARSMPSFQECRDVMHAHVVEAEGLALSPKPSQSGAADVKVLGQSGQGEFPGSSAQPPIRPNAAAPRESRAPLRDNAHALDEDVAFYHAYPFALFFETAHFLNARCLLMAGPPISLRATRLHGCSHSPGARQSR
jgi:hypothetical protein